MPMDNFNRGKGYHSSDMDDLEDIFRRVKGRIRLKKTPGIGIIALIILVIWLASGIYIVAPDEAGVVKRFGKYVYTTSPGPHYHLPYPIESVMKPKVTQVRRLEIGFRTVALIPKARYQYVPDEALMLTGDENIISIEFIVQYKIKDPVAFLFNVKDMQKTVKDAAEASIREIIGKNNIDDALTVGKYRIQQETKALLQRILDSYNSGISMVAVQLQDVHPPKQVAQAFKDVASAREDKIRLINNAQAYRNDILPKAKGNAERIIQEAVAYKEAVVKRAEGEVARFKKALQEYQKAKEITRQRIYIETMEEILPNIEKIVVEGKPGSNLLPLLPLREGLKSLEESGK